MRQTFSILIIFLISINGFSQCDDIDKLEFGGTYGGRPYKQEITFKYDLDWSKYCCDINKIKKYADFILPISKNYIIKRAGSDFFEKLKIHYLMVRYDDSVEIDYSNEKLYELSNFENYSYWIVYEYWNGDIEYGFGLEFNKNGELISENKFPDFSLNPKFENLNEPCLALDKVKSHEQFKDKKVDYIELSYLDEVNSFCWLVKEKYNVYENQNIDFEKWYDYSEKSFYVNVNSNEIEKIEDNQSRVIYCGPSGVFKKGE